MLELNNAIHSNFRNFKSLLMAKIEQRVSPSLLEKFAVLLPADNGIPLSEQDNYKLLSALRLLSAHRLTDKRPIDKNHSRAVLVPKTKVQGGLCMKGRIWTREKCPVCGKSFKPTIDELTGDCTDLKCPEHHTRPRYLYIDAREFKVGRLYSDKRGNKFDSFLMARRQLEAMRRADDEHTFDPDDWSLKRLKEYNVKTLALEWLVRLEKRSSYSHYSHCKREMTLHIFPLLQDFDVRDIRTKHIDDLYEALIDKKLAPKSIKNCLGTLRNFLRKMQYREIIKDLPRFPVFEVHPVREKGWIGKEKQQLILFHIPEREKIIFETLYETADRPCEGVAHRKKDLIEDECGIITERSFDVKRKLKREKSGKTIMKRISPELMEKLLEHSKNMLPEAWLFTTPQGKPYRQDTLSSVWRKAARKEGINISLYNATRHSKASRRRQELMAEVDAIIGEEIGDDPKTAKKHYILRKDKEL